MGCDRSGRLDSPSGILVDAAVDDSIGVPRPCRVAQVAGPGMKKHKVANYLRKRYGYCKDKDFQVGCVCCEVSRVIRYLEGHKQRVSNVVQQRLMAHDCPDHKYPDVCVAPSGGEHDDDDDYETGPLA